MYYTYIRDINCLGLVSYFILHTRFLALRTPLIETLLAVRSLSLNILPAAPTKKALRKLTNAALQSNEIYPDIYKLERSA